MKKKTNIHFLFIILAATLWGFSGLFARTANKYGITEMTLVFLRAALTVIIMGVGLFIYKKELFKIKPKDIYLFACDGILSVLFFNFCYYTTMSYTSLSVAAVLMYTAPFFVAIMSVFIFKQPLTVKKCLACLVAFIGCCFVTGVIGSSASIGAAAIIFGILTGFGYSLYTIFSRLLLDRGYNSLTITFYTFVFSAVGCIPFIDYGKTAKIIIDDPQVMIVIFLMAIFNTILPYFFYTIGLLGVDPSIAPIIAMIEPVVATLVGVVIFKEKITFLGVVGIVLVIASVAVLNMGGKKGVENEEAQDTCECKN